MMTDENTGKVNNYLQFVSLQAFIEHFKNNDDWFMQVQSDTSPFLNLLNSDEIFLKSESQV